MSTRFIVVFNLSDSCYTRPSAFVPESSYKLADLVWGRVVLTLDTSLHLFDLWSSIWALNITFLERI